MKSIVALLVVLNFGFNSFSQVSKVDLTSLKKAEDSMGLHAFKIVQGITEIDRLNSDSIFTRMLVRSLKIKNSFAYPFEKLETISKLYAPDSTFRIFTWQMFITDNMIRQHGAIQMKTDDGSLKLFPLIDRSDVIENIEDTIAGNFNWIGAVYYKIVRKKVGNKDVYTLLGYDENNIRSSKKLIEVLTFENGSPVFGGRYFSIPNDKIKAKSPARFVMEYKKEAGPRLTYDKELDLIIMEHLISESNQPNKKFTLIGDGDYEGFKWTAGKWVYISKVFNEVTPEGQAPIPQPIRDAKGTIDDSKLKGGELEKPQ